METSRKYAAVVLIGLGCILIVASIYYRTRGDRSRVSPTASGTAAGVPAGRTGPGTPGAGKATAGSRTGRDSSGTEIHIPDPVDEDVPTSGDGAGIPAGTRIRRDDGSGGTGAAGRGQERPEDTTGRRPKVVKYRDHDNLTRGLLSGRITDSLGAPVEGAHVGLFRANLRGRPYEVARSDADGGYAIGPHRTGRYSLHVSATGFAPVIEQVEIRVSGATHDVTLSAGAAITGMVQTADNAAVLVELKAERPGWIGRAQAEAGKNFRIENVPKGAVVLRAEAPGYVYAKTRLSVNTDSGEVGAGTLILAAGALLSGKTVNASNGEPLAEVSIVVTVPGGGAACIALTDNAGAFSINGVPAAQPLDVKYSLPGYAAGTTQIPAIQVGESREISIELSPAQAIRGKVVTDAGVPAARTSVKLLFEIDGKIQTISGVTDESGDFSLSSGNDFSEGTDFRIIVTGSPFAPKIEKLGAVPKENLVITVFPACVLSGTILGADGKPAELAGIRAVPKWLDGAEALYVAVQVHSGAEGVYELRGLGPGEWALRIMHPPAAPWLSDISFTAAGETKEKDISLTPGWKFEGTVTDMDGNPVADAVVTLNPSSKLLPYVVVKSDSGGKFEFNGLGDFGYSVSVSHPGYKGVSGESISKTSPSSTFILAVKE
ncbi:MAG: carboxypeptidase-like regulatory domain-containing protein [Planctomycetota bacterium]|jgi:hypothetical protein